MERGRGRKGMKGGGIEVLTDPSSFEIHALIVRAFNIVSAVVKVFDTTTTADDNKKTQISVEVRKGLRRILVTCENTIMIYPM